MTLLEDPDDHPGPARAVHRVGARPGAGRGRVPPRRPRRPAPHLLARRGGGGHLRMGDGRHAGLCQGPARVVDRRPARAVEFRRAGDALGRHAGVGRRWGPSAPRSPDGPCPSTWRWWPSGARRAPAPVEGVVVVPELAALVGRADHVVVAAPATARTRHLLDAAAFAAMKPGAHVVNIARGSLVDQEALRRALDDGTVARATLDTVEPEPLPAGHWLYTHPAVRLTPHISWSSPDTMARTVELFVREPRALPRRRGAPGRRGPRGRVLTWRSGPSDLVLCSGTLPRATPSGERLEAAQPRRGTRPCPCGAATTRRRAERATATPTSWPCWTTTGSPWPSWTLPGGGRPERRPSRSRPSWTRSTSSASTRASSSGSASWSGRRSLNAADVLGGRLGRRGGGGGLRRAVRPRRRSTACWCISSGWPGHGSPTSPRPGVVAPGGPAQRRPQRRHLALRPHRDDGRGPARRPGDRVLAVQLDDGPARGRRRPRRGHAAPAPSPGGGRLRPRRLPLRAP